MDERILEGFKKLGIQVKNETTEYSASSKINMTYEKCSVLKKTNLYFTGQTINKK